VGENHEHRMMLPEYQVAATMSSIAALATRRALTRQSLLRAPPRRFNSSKVPRSKTVRMKARGRFNGSVGSVRRARDHACRPCRGWPPRRAPPRRFNSSKVEEANLDKAGKRDPELYVRIPRSRRVARAAIEDIVAAIRACVGRRIRGRRTGDGVVAAPLQLL
jgi:hypothetical protein